MNLEKKKGEITMFELLGCETEHEAAVKRTINLQQEIMANLEADLSGTQKKKPTTK